MNFDPELSGLLKDLGFKGGDKPTAKQLNDRLAAAEQRGRDLGRQEMIAALRDGSAYMDWAREEMRAGRRSGCSLADVVWAADYLESITTKEPTHD